MSGTINIFSQRCKYKNDHYRVKKKKKKELKFQTIENW